MLKNGLVTFHIFKTSTSPRDEHFAPIARHSYDCSVDLEINASMMNVLNWHYKHIVIISWEGTSLIFLMRDFPTADADIVAPPVDQDVEFATSLALSADFLWDFDC